MSQGFFLDLSSGVVVCFVAGHPEIGSDAMSWLYICPHCNARLNPNKTLILLAEHEERRMLVGFHPEPGNYEIYFPPDAELEEGQFWDFFCPVCQVNLAIPENDRMCAVLMLEPGVSRRVGFSRVAGEHATEIVYDQELEHRYRENTEAYGRRLIPIKSSGAERRDQDESQEGEAGDNEEPSRNDGVSTEGGSGHGGVGVSNAGVSNASQVESGADKPRMGAVASGEVDTDSEKTEELKSVEYQDVEGLDKTREEEVVELDPQDPPSP